MLSITGSIPEEDQEKYLHVAITTGYCNPRYHISQ